MSWCRCNLMSNPFASSKYFRCGQISLSVLKHANLFVKISHLKYSKYFKCVHKNFELSDGLGMKLLTGLMLPKEYRIEIEHFVAPNVPLLIMTSSIRTFWKWPLTGLSCLPNRDPTRDHWMRPFVVFQNKSVAYS